MATETSNSSDQPTPAWHRWFRRTNVYIGEYVLMLVLMASFLGLLVSLWYSFFQLVLNSDSFTTSTLVRVTAGQLGALLVVGPAAYWMYSRVTGQEGVQAELQAKTSRTVFLSIWMLGAVLALVGLAASVGSALVTWAFGFADNAGDLFVSTIVPGVLAAVTLAFGVYVVVKHASRKFVMQAAVVLAALAFALLVANLVMVAGRKDEKPAQQACTYTNYIDKKCSYSEYLQQYSQQYNMGNNSSRSSMLQDLLNSSRY